MASDIIRVLADPVYVAKFQRFCGVVLEKPEKIDQQTQTRERPLDSDSSDQDEKTQELQVNSGATCVSHEKLDNAELRQRPVETNNNLSNTNNKSKRSNKKKAYTIEPTSRIYSKGSIFDCDDPSSTKDAPNNGSYNKQGSSAPGYQIKFRPLLYLAYFGAFLGNEEFYLTFFPFCIWNVDFLIVRQVAMLWGVVMYVGQATKDFLRWPRPPCPPVVRLETSYIQEFSMPSTHAMAGTAIPMYLAHLAIERYQVSVPVAVTVAVVWFTVTCFSRLYLGVHSILDLLAGFAYSVLIFFTFLRYVEDYDCYQQTNMFAVPAILVASLMLCTVCYPDSHKNSSKGDAVQIVGALAGTAIGSWIGYQMGYMHEPQVEGPYSVDTPTLAWVGLSLLRFVLGLAVVAVVYVATRWSSIQGFSWLYGLDRPDKSNPAVMTSYKFVTYSIVGTTISLLVPLIHLQLGIHRPAIFYEVL